MPSPQVLNSARELGLEQSRLEFLDRIVRRGVSAATVEAMSRVPREMFVPHSLRSEAYEDVALPTAEGQTISQPSLVASMVDLLELDPSHRVLEVGAGSGYQAAVLSLLASQVVSVERIPELTTNGEGPVTSARVCQVPHRTGRRRNWMALGRPLRPDCRSGGGPESAGRAFQPTRPRWAHGHSGRPANQSGLARCFA